MVQPIPPLDPERADWEADTLLSYAVCAGMHRASIDAWNDLLKGKK